ncbi:XrtA system polysaccharide chain length determinant [Magnetospirillum molischianum]|uniref:Putative Polysaccharide chain length determinant protein n=1 Tax=Magnetospirillum molischianum DSM 120 TaxID=1150626 RepID=H8FQB5_MAGML|nr:XrtA system polysaccharide chain length determinant [Magnetospirillum molischianum]CCG40553.1 putative Polysaccharide chain length determinant protein [Magnetospirillum molischianum DSM 120]
MVSLTSYIPQNVHDHLHTYWQRRWLVLMVAWVVAVLGWLVVAVIPDQYKALTRVYVETDNLLTPLLRNIAVQPDVQRQLEVMQRTLLSRSNVAQVARATDLDLNVHTDADADALYARLQRKVEVKSEGKNLFSLTYSDSNPEMAKKVVEAILNIFVETNLGQNRSNMESARGFIEKHISEYEQKLKVSEQKLSEYKTKNVETISAIGSNFSAKVDQSRQELVNAQSHYDEAVIARDMLRANLSAIPQYLDGGASPQVVISSAAPNSTEGRIQQLENELVKMRLNYTERHPDVIATSRALDQLRAQAAKETADPVAAKSTSQTRIPNALYEQVKLRLIQAESNLATAAGQLRLATQTRDRLASLAEEGPRIEADLADLNREYGVLRQKYEELLSRRESARISEAVESSGDKVQFRIIEAPQVPAIPSFPNRPLLVSLVLVVGIAAGFSVAFLLSNFEDTVKSKESIFDLFNIRVLGGVTMVQSISLEIDHRREVSKFIWALSSLFVLYGIVMVLTPYIQTFAKFVMRTNLYGLVERLVSYVSG